MNAKITAIRYKSEPQKGGRFWVVETDQGICKGKSELDINVGDYVTVDGEWRASKYNGQREFLFSSLLPSLPVTSRARFEYACSMTKGIGPAVMEKIWAALGEDWAQSVLDDIPGIGRDTKAAWKTTLIEIENQGRRADVFSWLMQAGLTANMATAAWVKWGEEAAGVVHQNPYRLAELPHYGFLTVDEIVLRGAWGIDRLDPRRIRAALLHLLDKNAGDGHTAVLMRECLEQASVICPDITFDLFREAMETPEVVSIGAEYGIDNTYLARRIDYKHETIIWERWK